ncbi:dedicator of cytokinesis protein 1-like [Ostrinia furnacalis]|uniref:dedicator of cytokinesis protein 1-like n=1 Tax=Ostrinia furnacalis TaxID=93504 RepID=UPI00103D3FB0|nr:dedicator of cytokinesis protein 1-like [Ostrinia furnacalis]
MYEDRCDVVVEPADAAPNVIFGGPKMLQDGRVVSGAYIVSALDALPLGRLSKQRMLALLELVKGPLCAAPAAWTLLIPQLSTNTAYIVSALDALPLGRLSKQRMLALLELVNLPIVYSAYIVSALDALPLGRLSKQRMLALLELVKGPLCAAPAARALLLPHLASTVRALLKEKAELERDAALKSRSVDKAARLLGADTARLHDTQHAKQLVELCVEALGEVMTLLARDDVGPVEADRGELARRLLPTVLTTAASMLKERKTDEQGSADDPLLRRIICVLLDMVRQASDEQYTMVVKALEAEHPSAARCLVGDALALLTELLRRPVFRAHWAAMLHLQHTAMLQALRLLATTLRDRLAAVDELDTEAVSGIHEMWREWFTACSALATSPVLQLETLPPARKQRVTGLYGDIRRHVASMLSEMWFGLGEHKRSFIPCLVGPFLEVSFLRDEEVRNTTIPLFFDMMQTEYMHSVASGESEGLLKDLESELIDKLDVLVESGRGDSQWRARFVSLCGALCGAAAGPLRVAAAALVAAGARQLDTLLQYRAAAVRSATPHRMHLTTRVLHFYEQIERPHMYIRYVHKLANMHHSAGQWAEAGLALRLHAKLLSWTPEPLPPRLRHPSPHTAPAHSTHRELKEYLYLEIAELLNRGRQWEIAVEIVKELVSVYEEEALGYGPLAELHGQLAGLYGCMLRTPRYHPGYFRVVYYGRGFPEHLTQPHGFVYRGNEYEQLAEFKERCLDEWPDADVLMKLDPPGDDVVHSDGQYLQINAVEPVTSDKLKRLSGKPVADQILMYYKHNNVDKFVFSRPFHRPEESLNGSSDDLSSQNEFATRWLERTELEISDKLPGILRWFPVVKQRTYWVSPVEAAVEALRESNRALKALILSARAPDAPLQPLTMRLNGILDPAVQGGIVNYERAFLTPSYEARHPEHAELLTQLKDLIADQIPLLKFGLEVHGARVPASMEALHSHMSSQFKRVQQHVHQRYGRKMADFEPETPEVQLRTMRDSLPSDAGNTTNNRISDISTGTNESSRSKFFSFNSAINPLASRNSSGGGYLNFGTLQSTPKRRDKRKGRKSEVGASGSQWYTSSTPNGTPSAVNNNVTTTTTNNNNQEQTTSASPLRELRQEVRTLVTERPLRADVERERRLSQRTSLLTSSAPPSNRDSMGTTDSNQDDEEPPPLPEKLSHRSMELDETNNNTAVLPPRNNYDTVWTPRGSFLYNSLAMRRNTGSDKPPTPPPKKKNAQNNT